MPSGVWAAEEYDKLAGYDGPTWTQSHKLFLCHQRDGHLCGGWLACHDPRHLVALRLHGVDPSAYDYLTDVPVFSSGAEARAHGLKALARPGETAERMIRSLLRRRRASVEGPESSVEMSRHEDDESHAHARSEDASEGRRT